MQTTPTSVLDRWLTQAPPFPQRIVCLTEETTEILYRVGAADRVVGVSGFTVRPPQARQKPRVSSFLDANFERILELQPDLVLGFSDLQADLGRELCRLGVPVYLFNQRSLAEILQTVRVVCALVGLPERGEALAQALVANLEKHAAAAQSLPRRPRVMFEEWHEPLISGIRWCSELIELCGGEDVFAENRQHQGAKARIVTAEEAAARQPDVVIASWCGRKAKPDKIRARPGWENVPAVQNDQLYEIRSSHILQPGPAALTVGVDQIAQIITAAAHGRTVGTAQPGELRRLNISDAFGSTAEDPVEYSRCMPTYALIVDADSKRRADHAHLAKTHGLSTEEVGDGAAALERVRLKGPPSVVLTELSLPKLDGFALLKELRKSIPKTPVVVVSAFAEMRNALVQRKEELNPAAILAAHAPLNSISRTLTKVLQQEKVSAPPPTAPSPSPSSTLTPPELQRLGLMDQGPQDQQLETLLKEVAEACGVPMALITFILKDKQWFKAHTGLGGKLLEERGTPIESSFCRHAAEARAPLVVPDARIHPVFARNDLVTAGLVRGYAGVPIIAASGRVFGTLCVLDTQTLKLGSESIEELRLLARRIAGELELRSARVVAPAAVPASLEGAIPVFEAMDAGILIMSGTDRRILYANRAVAQLSGVEQSRISQMTRDQWIAQNCTLFDDPSEFLEKLKVLPQGPFAAQEAFRVQRPEPKTIRWTARPVRLADQTVQLAIYEDVTPFSRLAVDTIDNTGRTPDDAA